MTEQLFAAVAVSIIFALGLLTIIGSVLDWAWLVYTAGLTLAAGGFVAAGIALVGLWADAL